MTIQRATDPGFTQDEIDTCLDRYYRLHVQLEDDQMVKACVWALRHKDSPDALVEALTRHIDHFGPLSFATPP